MLNNPKNDFHILVLLALETGARRGELLGIKKEDIYEYGIRIKCSISPHSDDILLKQSTLNAMLVSIKKSMIF